MMGKHDADVPVAAVAENCEVPREVDIKIEYGTPAFWQTNFSLFAAGFATFALLYCVQPLMPLFSADFGVSPAGASLALSLTTGLLSVSMLVAGALSEAVGRKPIMVASLLLSALLTVICALRATLADAASRPRADGRRPQRSAGSCDGLCRRRDASAFARTCHGTVCRRHWLGRHGRPSVDRRYYRYLGLAHRGNGHRHARDLVCRGVVALFAASRHFVRRELRLAPLVRAFGMHLRDGILPLLFVEGFLLMGSFVTVYNYVGYRLIAPPFSLSQTHIGLIFVGVSVRYSQLGLGGQPVWKAWS